MPNLPIQEISDTLVRLHEKKDRSYKDAWRRRGEILGIFCNIARKYDRLELSRHEGNTDAAEPPTDTAADLCIYSCKYLTWLIEHDPDSAAAVPGATPTDWSANRGHAALTLALDQLASEADAPPAALATAFTAVQQPFTQLEQILLEQQQQQQQASATTKAGLAWQLASGSLFYLWRLALDDNAAWRRFTTYVATLA